MTSFEDYVTDSKIIDALIKMRVKLADQRNAKHLLNGLSPNISVQNLPRSVELESLMPPRRKWLTLKERHRFKRDIDPHGNIHTQIINTFDKNQKILKLTINQYRQYHTEESFVINLNGFIEEIKADCSGSLYMFNSPILYAEPKNNILSEQGKIECRPISTFTNLKDRVILSLLNKYFTILFDSFFIPNSLAFRAKRLYYGELKYTSHHDSIDRILEYRNQHQNKNIYVAECDMQKFYDTVNHRIVKKEFCKLMLKVRRVYPYLDFSAASTLFYRYLDCYTFPKNVLSKNKKQDFWETQKEPRGKFEWVENELINAGICKSLKGISNLKVGVPQGGALSGLIANIVLNAVDHKIINLPFPNVLYTRYCDDMILFTTKKKDGKRILREYENGLINLKLIPHKNTPVASFRTKDFWKGKSKGPYKWDKSNGAFWIGFVGYEINRDGDIRIRKKSLIKEKEKQKEVISSLFEELENKRRLSNKSIERSYINRLTGMSIGRVNLWNYSTLKNELCWINGFKMLNDNKYVEKQIKDLDRHRNFLINKAKKKLTELETREIIRNEERDVDDHIYYYGKPYSYYYHWKKNGD